MTVTAMYTFDSKEHYRALRAIARYNPARPFIFIMGIAVPALAMWFVVRDWQRLSPMGVLINGAPWILLGAFYLSFMPLVLRSLARRAQKDDPSLRGEQTRTVNSAGLEIRGANFLQHFPWADIRRADETNEFFLFFYNGRQAYYLPKRVLSDEDVVAVRALVRSHIDAAPGHSDAPI